jgi:hypothetical protein
LLSSFLSNLSNKKKSIKMHLGTLLLPSAPKTATTVVGKKAKKREGERKREREREKKEKEVAA